MLARVFPGVLHLVSLNFTKDMSDRSSAEFQRTASSISEVLREALRSQPGYIRSDVISLTQGSVVATVYNVFQTGSGATQISTNQAIERAITESGTTPSLLSKATFSASSLCAQGPLSGCDDHTTSCEDVGGMARCTCRPGYVTQLPYSNISCEACPSGQRAEGDVCQPCSFGYAGFNCNDSSLLAVVVVSCVLGGILLIIILALIFYCWRGRSYEGKPDPNTSSSPYPVENFHGAWPGQGLTIPRATSHWEGAGLEMTEGGSTHALVEQKPHTNGGTGSYDVTTDSMNTFKGKNPSRYSYLVQGHENPYFIPGDESRPS